MDFASLRASYARYTLVLSLLSGLSCFQYAPFVAAAVDADEALGMCQVDTLPKDIDLRLHTYYTDNYDTRRSWPDLSIHIAGTASCLLV